MSEFFLQIVNMSVSASWALLAVLILRFFLKKTPKWITVLLWGIVAVRLLCPISNKSVLSLIPSAKTFPSEILSGPSFRIQTGITSLDNQINGYLGSRYYEGVTVSAHNGYHMMTLLAAIWITGIVILIAYTVYSYWRLCKKVDTAVLLRDQVFQSEHVISPFVLGMIKPKIYLPFDLSEQNMEAVIAHEQAHIRRRDHWWKPLGFLLLTAHWFNPLIWLGYLLFFRDIELACDEKVVKKWDCQQRTAYSQALLACITHRSTVSACPLAFGETEVKNRIQSVLRYQKPSFRAILAAILSCIIAGVCFLTNPQESSLQSNVSVTGGADQPKSVSVMFEQTPEEQIEEKMDNAEYVITKHIIKTMTVSGMPMVIRINIA